MQQINISGLDQGIFNGESETTVPNGTIVCLRTCIRTHRLLARKPFMFIHRSLIPGLPGKPAQSHDLAVICAVFVLDVKRLCRIGTVRVIQIKNTHLPGRCAWIGQLYPELIDKGYLLALFVVCKIPYDISDTADIDDPFILCVRRKFVDVGTFRINRHIACKSPIGQIR